MKKRKLFFIIIGVLFIALLIWRLQKTIHQKRVLATMPNPIVYPRVEVTLPVEKEVEDFLESWGVVVSENSTIVYSNLPGLLLEERVKVGDLVKVHDTLAIVDRNLRPQEFKHYAVLSPLQGVVTQRFQSLGATITPQTPLYQIESIHQPKVICKANQKTIGKIQLNQKVKIYCNAFEGEEFYGTVSKIYPTTDQSNHITKFEVSIHSSKLRPGMYVDLKIHIGKVKGLFVPVQAVYERSNVTKVGIFQNNTVRIQTVRAGKRIGNERLIEGITNNDTIITSGIDWLSDGDTVVVSSSL